MITEAIGSSGLRAGGFLTKEIRRQGRREGFDIVTLDGRTAPLAHISFTSPFRVGKYGVDVRGLERVGVRALEKAGFRIARQGKHIVMTDGTRIVTIPRHNPVNAFTMGGIVRDAGLSPEEFKKLL